MLNKRRFTAGALTMILCASTLTGCSGSIVGTDAASYPLTAALTQQEVLDYYAASMDYDTVISRNNEVDVNNYEVKEVTSVEKLEALKTALSKTQEYLKSSNYKSNADSNRYLTDEMYNYIRAMLNDKSLKNGRITSTTQALGYYFIDVEYDIGDSAIGTFKPTISLIGMSGGYVKNSLTGEDSVDTSFLTTAKKTLEDYFKENGMTATVEYNSGANTFLIKGLLEETQPDYSSSTIDAGNNSVDEVSSVPSVPNAPGNTTENTETDETDENESNIPDVGNTTDTESNTETTTETTTDGTKEEAVISKPQTNTPVAKKYTARTTGLDLNLFNKVVGFGSNKAYIPRLDLIYNIPASSNDAINGIGLYPSGALGLSEFGVNRENAAGTCTLRYVYKEDLANPNLLTCTNIYVTYYDMASGFSANNDSIIPEFLSSEFGKLLERADRAMVNCDIAGLASGNIFEDIGMAVLQGYTENYGNILRQISTIRRILSRDMEKNSYLVEIESYRQEGAESADLYASYKDTIYAVIKQKGSEFVITDWMTMKRQLVGEPDINPDSAAAKRVVALGLTGAVSDEAKESATSLLNELYTASTMRLLTGPKTLDDGTVIERGMYDCFNSNPEMLPSSVKEELNSDIRKLLVRYGTNNKSFMNGQVTEWIGGSENQVEFTTEELITYTGHNDGVYMTCYYLVSNMEGAWVIDDIQVLSQEDVSGDGLNAIKQRIGVE